MLPNIFTRPSFLRFSSSILRTFFPVLSFRGWVIISRYVDVKEVLTRDQDFAIAEINQPKMHEVGIDFFLGMDASEIHDREKDIMESVAKREDLLVIQKIVAEKSQSLVNAKLASKRIDVVSELSRLVPLTLIEEYFGVPIENKEQMQGWLRKLFNHLFLNLTNDITVAADAKQAANELKLYMENVISKSKRLDQTHKLSEGTLLFRLLSLQTTNPFVTDDFIRRNLCGVMIGAVETTSKCVVLVLEELLRRPFVLAEAAKTEVNKLKNICYEALRFNPHNPIVVRFCKADIKIGSQSQYRIKANRKVAVNIFSAMHDRHEFERPASFNSSRSNEYLHFGFGLHACFGRYINAIQIPEIVKSLVQLKGIRRSSLTNGKINYEGSFPNAFLLDFD
jgi:cytochrome P450